MVVEKPPPSFQELEKTDALALRAAAAPGDVGGPRRVVGVERAGVGLAERLEFGRLKG